MRGRWPRVVALLLAGALVAGCGSDAGSATSPPTTGSLTVPPGAAAESAGTTAPASPGLGAGDAAPSATGAAGSASGTRGPAPGASAIPPSAGGTEQTTEPATSGAAAQPIVAPPGPIHATTSRLRLPGGLSRTVVFADGATILVCGGLTAHGTTGTVLRVDTVRGRVRPVGRLASATHDAAGAALRDMDLLLGGGVVTQSAVVQRITPTGRGDSIGLLPAPRADLGAVAIGGQVVVLGGGAGGRADPRVLATTDGVHFHVIATLPVAVRYAAVGTLGGRIYVFGGTAAAGDVATIQVVDPATGRAAVIGHLATTLSHATAFVLGGRLLIAGGRHAGRPLAAILAFDTATGRTSTAGRLPRPLSDAAAAVIDGTAYLVGGESTAPVTTIEVLTPS